MNRIDKILVDQGFAQSRTQAQKLIAAGAVKMNRHAQLTTLSKASAKYPDDILLHVDAIDELKYVSRAGLKLESAFSALISSGLLGEVNLESLAKDKTALDIGQSTGGFTDFLLQAGAERVIGVDVGHDQLANRLQQNPRVVSLEGMNARDLPDDILHKYSASGFDFIVMDVSFISQTLILPNLPSHLAKAGLLVSLVKPQFEAGRENIGKGGIIKDPKIFKQVEQKVRNCIEENGLQVIDYFKSGLVGADGNQEFFVVAANTK